MSTESGDALPLREVQWLGVETRSVSDRSTARQLGLPRVIRGALVNRVIPRMPAGRAGLKRGDVITEIKVGRGRDEIGYSIASRAQLESVLMQLENLGHFSVEVFRGPAPLNRSSYATRLFRVRLERK
jgi:C-terminal processing protease CtpA/Prc